LRNAIIDLFPFAILSIVSFAQTMLSIFTVGIVFFRVGPVRKNPSILCDPRGKRTQNIGDFRFRSTSSQE